MYDTYIVSVIGALKRRTKASLGMRQDKILRHDDNYQPARSSFGRVQSSCALTARGLCPSAHSVFV